MKICPRCQTLHREHIMVCQNCKGTLQEVSLKEALSLTQQKAFEDSIQGKGKRQLTDSYKQYHIRGYLKNRSLFLDFDLYKNRLKHGRRLKRFFIAPVRITTLLNIPWFIFNVINSNLFHMQYTEFCPRCEMKYRKGTHTDEECDYNIEYFNILDDILTGKIVARKIIYEEFARIRRQKGLKSAYADLFYRPVHWEIFWDLISVGFSVGFWLYILVFILYPWMLTGLQNIQQWEIVGQQVLILR